MKTIIKCFGCWVGLAIGGYVWRCWAGDGNWARTEDAMYFQAVAFIYYTTVDLVMKKYVI